MKSLSVQNYLGNTMLGTTASTTFDKGQSDVKELKGPDLLQIADKKVNVQDFEYVD